MSDEALYTRAQIDGLDLPLQLATPAIAQAGQLIDRLRATQSRPTAEPSQIPDTGLLSLARTIYRFRRKREEIFGPKVFSDGNWDILLDLFIAHEQGRKISISSACLAACVPATTALRHLSALAKYGMISRVADDQDGRSARVALTSSGYEKIVSLLRCWPT